jgi:hypothetical protein
VCICCSLFLRYADRDSSTVYAEAESLWSGLPRHLRLETTLRSFKARTPFEQDFILSARLDYLQILFLLRSGNYLNQSADSRQDHTELFKISEEIFSLVVEAVMRRDSLVNSGTGLIWKVSRCSFDGLIDPTAKEWSLIHSRLHITVCQRLALSRFPCFGKDHRGSQGTL